MYRNFVGVVFKSFYKININNTVHNMYGCCYYTLETLL